MQEYSIVLGPWLTHFVGEIGNKKYTPIRLEFIILIKYFPSSSYFAPTCHTTKQPTFCTSSTQEEKQYKIHN